MTRDLRDWIEQVEAIGSLERVADEVHWDEEMGAISYCAHKTLGAPALLFEDVTGSPDGYRALWNMFASSPARLAVTMHEDPELSMKELISIGRDHFGSTLEPVTVDDGPVYEHSEYGDDVDLTRFPAPKMWPQDGGRYIGTACAAVSRNPETGALNVGTYRGMLHSAHEVGVQAQRGKDLRNHLEAAWERGEPLEIAVAYGIQPELLLVSGSKYAEAENEYHYAGGVRGSPMELVEGEHTGLPIPAHAEIVAEGRVEVGDLRGEGPFGEFTGYYGEELDEVPVLTVEALHHRDDPILTVAAEAPYPGGDNGVKSVAMRGSRIWNTLDELGVPNVRGVYNPPGAAAGGGMTIVSIEQDHPGHAAQVASVVSGAPVSAYFQKLVVVVDDDVDPTDLDQVLWAIATRLHPAEDVQVIEDTWGYELDPSLPPDRRMQGAKLWLDATKNYAAYGDVPFPERLELRRATYEAVAQRWADLDLDVPFPDLPSLYEGDDAGPTAFGEATRTEM